MRVLAVEVFDCVTGVAGVGVRCEGSAGAAVGTVVLEVQGDEGALAGEESL